MEKSPLSKMRKNLFCLTFTVFFACLFTVNVNAVNADPSLVVPTTAEFQTCFTSDWKHPWEFPKNSPVYYEENGFQNMGGQKVISGRELGGGLNMADSYQSLPADQKNLALESYKIQFSMKNEEEVLDLFRKLDEIYSNTNISFATFVIYTGPELKEGEIIMGLIPQDTATVTIGVIDEKYFGKYRDDLISVNFNYDEDKRNEILSKLTDLSVKMARQMGMNITDTPTQKVKIDKKDYGEISYCEQMIYNGVPDQIKTCSLLNGNIQITLKLESHSKEEHWTDQQIDCLLKLLDEKTRHKEAGITFTPNNITSTPKTPGNYHIKIDWTLESGGPLTHNGNPYNNLVELIDKEGASVEAKLIPKDGGKEISTGDMALGEDTLEPKDGSSYVSYISGVVTVYLHHETLDQLEAAIDEYNKKNYDYKTAGEGKPYQKEEMSFTVKLVVKDDRKATITETDSSAGNTALTYRIKKPIIFIPGIAGSMLKGSDGTEYWPAALIRMGDLEFWRPMQLNEEGVGVPMDTPDIVRSYYIDVYGGFPKYIEKQLGYTQGEDLLLFPYDWRMDNRFHTKYPLHNLGKVVDEALDKNYNRMWGTTRKPTDQVVIVAHSMGGIVTRYYVQNPENAQKVDAVIMLGTPNHGSAKAFRALGTTGYSFDVPWLDQDVAKEVGANWASAYQLMPFEDFLFDESGNPQKSSDTLSTYKSYSQGELKPLNSILLGDRIKFQNEIQTFPKDIKLFIIGGWDVATPNGFMKTRRKIYKMDSRIQPEWLEYTTTTELVEFGDKTKRMYVFDALYYGELHTSCGDGTVPLDSTVLPEARMLYSKGVSHMDLVKEDDPREKVKSLLKGVMPEVIGKPCSSAPKPNHQEVVQYKVRSPADLHVYDGEGRHAGKTSEGLIENNIPGSAFDVNYGTQTFTAPYSEETFNVELIGTEDRMMDFEVVESHDGRLTELSFNNLTEKEGSVYNFNHQTGNLEEGSILSVDEDGDGNLDEQLTADSFTEREIEKSGGEEGEEQTCCCCCSPLLPAAIALSISILLGVPYALNKRY